VRGSKNGTMSDPRQHATLMQAGSTWQRHTLRGKFLVLTSGPGVGQMLAIEDNDNFLIFGGPPKDDFGGVMTLAGYWDDYHRDWDNCAPNLGTGDQTPTTFAIQEPGTIISKGVTLPRGIGGLRDEEKAIENWAAFIASNLRGGATSHYLREGDHTQYMIQRFKIVSPVEKVLFVDSAENISARYISSYRLPDRFTALYTGQNSPNWSVMSSYADQRDDVNPVNGTKTFAGVSRFYTADVMIAMFGNVIDGGGAYFGDQVDAITAGRVSVQINGESNRDLVADDWHIAAIHIRSGADVHIVGTLIDGSPSKKGSCHDSEGKVTECPRITDCIRLGERAGFAGHLYFEGGDLSNCGSAGLSAFGNWIVEFISWPASSDTGLNGRFGLQASNGAKFFGVQTHALGGDDTHKGCEFSGGVSITGKFGPMTFDSQNSIEYKDIDAPNCSPCMKDANQRNKCVCVNNTNETCEAVNDTVHGPHGGFFTSGQLSTQQNISYPAGTIIRSGNLSIVPEVGHVDIPDMGQAQGEVILGFKTPFAGNPECVCTDQTAATPVQCKPLSPTQLKITGPVKDTISYQCFGNK